MVQTLESWYQAYLTEKLEAAATTLEVNVAPTVTKWRLYVTNWAQEERLQFSWVSGTTLQNLTRGLSKTATPSTAWTGKTRLAGTIVLLVPMHDQLWDILEGNQALFEAKTYATTAARDAALWGDWVATKAYYSIYVTATWLFYNYSLSSNQRTVIDTGTATPNASQTAAWSVENATTAEWIAWSSVWWTWALLFMTPAQIAAQIQSGTWISFSSATGSDTYVAAMNPALTAYTTNMVVVGKFTTANTGACSINIDSLGAKSIKTVDGNDPQDGVIRANSVHVLVYDGTNFVVMTPDFATTSTAWTIKTTSQSNAEDFTISNTAIVPQNLLNFFNVIAWSTLVVSDDTTENTTSSTYVKLKQFTINKTGTYTVEFTIWGGWAGSYTLYGRIYKNGVAHGTERSWAGSYTENLAFTAWDTCELRWRINIVSGTPSLPLSNFRLKGALQLNTSYAPTLPADGIIATVDSV